MLYNERAEYILQQLQLQSTVKVSELSRNCRYRWIQCAGT